VTLTFELEVQNSSFYLTFTFVHTELHTYTTVGGPTPELKSPYLHLHCYLHSLSGVFRNAQFGTQYGPQSAYMNIQMGVL